MALPIQNFNLVLAGFLRQARAQNDALAYVNTLHAAALAAVLAQDEYVTQTLFEGSQNTAERNMPSATLLELCEAALQVLDAEAAAAAGTYDESGSRRFADFHDTPCILG